MSTYQRVVFVCEHGAAKSVLAATEFNVLAEARGAPARAVARGTAPDSTIAPIVVERLAREGIELGAGVPTELGSSDLEGALRVITFDQPQVAAMIPPGISMEMWNDMPAVSADFDRARQAIRTNVRALLDKLAGSDAFVAANTPNEASVKETPVRPADDQR